MDYKKIILKKGKEESLKRFHPWVFSGAIAKMDNDIEEGDLSVSTHRQATLSLLVIFRLAASQCVCSTLRSV